MRDKIILLFYTITLLNTIVNAQFSSIDITIDSRLLRSNEKQEILNLESDIKRFFLNTTWDNNYNDLKIPLYIQIIFEGVTEKGNQTIYNCQALFSNGGDLRYFDKNIQFYYNSSSSLYYDPVLFEPLTGILAYYANLILGGEIVGTLFIITKLLEEFFSVGLKTILFTVLNSGTFSLSSKFLL